MQGSKTRAIDVEGEHRAISKTAALVRRAIQGVARYNQSGIRNNSVAVRRRKTRGCRKPMPGVKTRAIGVDPEHRAIVPNTATKRRPIQGVAQSGGAR